MHTDVICDDALCGTAKPGTGRTLDERSVAAVKAWNTRNGKERGGPASAVRYPAAAPEHTPADLEKSRCCASMQDWARMPDVAAEYTVDVKMQGDIETLRAWLGASSNGEVIRRAIALMRLACDCADADKRILMVEARSQTLQRIALAA